MPGTMTCMVALRWRNVCATIWFAAAVLGGSVASAQPLTIAAASDLQYVMPRLAAQFERATGRKVSVTFGSSGNFVSQIRNGAPFDLFLSADIAYARRLEAEGLAEAGSLVEYATGRIVLWSRKDRVNVRSGLESLLDARVRRIAIANPDHAPYGRAAVSALQHERLYERVRAKLVHGENVAQAAQFVESGNADAGIIPLSLALDPALKDTGVYYEIPSTFHPAIAQAGVVIKASHNTPAAREFLTFLRAPAVVQTLRASGFSAPSSAGRTQ